jgi:hypothetical protein
LNKKLKEYFLANPQINAKDAIKCPSGISGARQTSRNPSKRNNLPSKDLTIVYNRVDLVLHLEIPTFQKFKNT